MTTCRGGAARPPAVRSLARPDDRRGATTAAQPPAGLLWRGRRVATASELPRGGTPQAAERGASCPN